MKCKKDSLLMGKLSFFMHFPGIYLPVMEMVRIYADSSFYFRIAAAKKSPFKKEDSAQSVLHVVFFLFFASGCEFYKLFACALRSVFIVIALCIAISTFGSAHILICSFFCFIRSSMSQLWSSYSDASTPSSGPFRCLVACSKA